MNGSNQPRRCEWVRGVLPMAAVVALLLAGCGDDDEGAVDTGASSTTVTTAATSTAVTTTTATTPDDAAIEPGLEEYTATCRDGEARGCRQLSDATLQSICDEGQTVACQTYGARTGEGDPEGDGTVAFEEGCRNGEFDACVQLTDVMLQAICDEGQTAACQIYLSRTGEG
jgi:hypothetical protein